MGSTQYNLAITIHFRNLSVNMFYFTQIKHILKRKYLFPSTVWSYLRSSSLTLPFYATHILSHQPPPQWWGLLTSDSPSSYFVWTIYQPHNSAQVIFTLKKLLFFFLGKSNNSTYFMWLKQCTTVVIFITKSKIHCTFIK